MPFRDQVFDYATNQFSYAHIQDKASFLREIARTLRPGARFVLTNIDPWAMTDWIIYRFFPEALELDQRDYLPLDRLRDLLSEAGFVDATIESKVDDRLEDLASLVQYVRVRHNLSQFLAITETAYEAGVRRVEDAFRQSEGSPVPSRRCFVTVRADRPIG